MNQEPLFLASSDNVVDIFAKGGGKAGNLARMSSLRVAVPEWFVVTTHVFDQFVSTCGIDFTCANSIDPEIFSAQIEHAFLKTQLSPNLVSEITQELSRRGMLDGFVAVRSSGLDEDSKDHSFAGQFSSFLYQKGAQEIIDSIKRCWASGFSARALCYRRENGLDCTTIKVGVVIQKMVDSTVSGVIFSRNPINLFDHEHLLNSATFGLGEGLVSGALDADEFVLSRLSTEVNSSIAQKDQAYSAAVCGGIELRDVDDKLRNTPCLSARQNQEIKELAIDLEKKLGAPLDIEWAYDKDRLFLLQARPITVCPNSAFYDDNINGSKTILWDNANIIESYSGVTSPLTFSFASRAYAQVYEQFLQLMGLDHKQINANDSVFRNMLGHIRGRVYYNLLNWYKVLAFLPLNRNSDQFMETMMGLSGSLPDDIREQLSNNAETPWQKKKRGMFVTATVLWRFMRKKTIVEDFKTMFNDVYNKERTRNFRKLSLPEQMDIYNNLENQVLKNWHAPIVNDFFCMLFFGVMKKLVGTWINDGSYDSLQNDLLCGQGHLESTEPTKCLMRIASAIDHGPAHVREEFLRHDAANLFAALKSKEEFREIHSSFAIFLDKYGFRSADELKLEEPDLHEDPSFALAAVQNYVKSKSYNIKEIEEREKSIREKAENFVNTKLSGLKRSVFWWVVKQARWAVATRESLRFDRTKIFGIVRHLFRAMGQNLTALELIDDEADVFYLEMSELMGFIEGRFSGVSLRELIAIRKKSFVSYRNEDAPPDRFITRGTVGMSLDIKKVLDDGNIFVDNGLENLDENVLVGTSCCPGKVVASVLATKCITEARTINGQILATERTDPGWVPLYPSCAGLIIERGSLLSHSAVVARELGLPTIVGVKGLMKRIQNGQQVELDATAGTVRLLP